MNSIYGAWLIASDQVVSVRGNVIRVAEREMKSAHQPEHVREMEELWLEKHINITTTHRRTDVLL